MSSVSEKIRSYSTTKKNFLFFGLIFLALAWVYRKYIFFSELFIFTDIGSDTMTLFYPNLLSLARTLRTEGIPLWSFFTGIGQGVFSKGIIDPFSWIYIALGQDYLIYGIGWIQFIKTFLISIISFHFLKLIGFKRHSVYLGVILLTFLGYVSLGSCWYGHLNNLMYMFIFLLAFEMILMKGKWWLVPIIVVYMMGPRLYFFTEFAIIYIILRLALMNILNWKTVFNAIPKFLGPGILGIFLAAPFLGSMVYKFLYSPRVGGEVSYTSNLMSKSIFEMESPLHYVTAIYRFFSNDILGTGDGFKGWNNYLEAPIFYCGIISLLLLPQVFRFLTKKQLIVISSILALWILVILFPYFRHAFYLFVGSYYKAALSFFIPFSIFFFGIIAFDKILQVKKLNLPLLGISLVALLILLFYPYNTITGRIVEEIQWIAGIFLIAYSLLLTLFHYSKGRAIFLYILLGLVLIEGIYMTNITLNNRETINALEYKNRTYHNDYTKEALEYIHSVEEPFYRIEKAYGSVLSGYNDGKSQGFFGTRSYSSHNHNNYINFLASLGLIKADDELYTRWVVGVQKIPQLHPFFSIKYMISNPQKDKAEIANWMYDDIGEMNGLRLYKNKYFLPLGIPYEQVISNTEFNKIGGYSDKLQLLYNAVVLDDDEFSRITDLKEFSRSELRGALNMASIHNRLKDQCMKMESFKQSRIKGSIELERPNILLFSFPFDDGWSAKIDGKSQDLIKVNNGLTGLYVEAGVHKIDLNYRPKFYLLSWIIFALSLAFYIFLIFRQKGNWPKPISSEATISTVGIESNDVEPIRKRKKKGIKKGEIRKKTIRKKRK